MKQFLLTLFLVSVSVGSLFAEFPYLAKEGDLDFRRYHSQKEFPYDGEYTGLAVSECIPKSQFNEYCAYFDSLAGLTPVDIDTIRNGKLWDYLIFEELSYHYKLKAGGTYWVVVTKEAPYYGVRSSLAIVLTLTSVSDTRIHYEYQAWSFSVAWN